MSLNLNIVMLAGNLTRDPELKTIGSGVVANFGLAINRKWKKDDGTAMEDVVFVDCEAWARTAEFLGKHFAKGQGAMVEGRLKLDSWVTVNQEKRTRLKVVVERVHFTGPKPGASNPAEATTRTAAAPATQPSMGAPDEPPF